MKCIETEEEGERAGAREGEREGSTERLECLRCVFPLNEKQVTVHCVSGLICKKPLETSEKMEKEGV
jgi:hypothetical protein